MRSQTKQRIKDFVVGFACVVLVAVILELTEWFLGNKLSKSLLCHHSDLSGSGDRIIQCVIDGKSKTFEETFQDKK
jgi:hypothetical protein